MNKNVLILKPYISETIWGGVKLNEYGYDCPYQRNGEAWLVSAIENKTSKISNLNNMDLKIFFENNPDFFDNYKGQYPLLVKIIDANSDLSIQVHPNDEYAIIKHNKLGKHECWYILDCDDEGTIIYGHNAKDIDELKSLINKKEWNKLLKTHSIKKGDIIDVPPGTVHAIKKNTLIFELQQSSDVTYRLYDYDRLENNKLRELHIDDALNVIYFPQENMKIKNSLNSGLLIDNKFFKLEKIINNGCEKYLYSKAKWIQATVIEGMGYIDDIPLNKGSTFLVRNNYEFKLNGNMEILISYIEKTSPN